MLIYFGILFWVKQQCKHVNNVIYIYIYILFFIFIFFYINNIIIISIIIFLVF